jgi:hypothetical protein
MEIVTKEVRMFMDALEKSEKNKVEIKECPKWVLRGFKTAVEFGLLDEFCTTVLNSKAESDLDRISEACREWDL